MTSFLAGTTLLRNPPFAKNRDSNPKTPFVPHRIATIVKSPRRRLIGSDSAGNVLDDALYKRPTCRVEVTGRISSEYLHGLLCGLRLKWETSKKNLPSNLLPIQEISSISLKSANARIFDSPSLRPSSRFILRQGERSSFTLKLYPDMEADQESRETIDAVFDMLNAPREEDLFRKPSLLITNCSLRMYAVVIESVCDVWQTHGNIACGLADWFSLSLDLLAVTSTAGITTPLWLYNRHLYHPSRLPAMLLGTGSRLPTYHRDMERRMGQHNFIPESKPPHPLWPISFFGRSDDLGGRQQRDLWYDSSSVGRKERFRGRASNVWIGDVVVEGSGSVPGN